MAAQTVHIGKVIRATVKARGLSVTEFADKINSSRRNTYQIFERQTIDTGLLIKISKVLKKNLFLEYVSEFEITDHPINIQAQHEVTKAALQALKDRRLCEEKYQALLNQAKPTGKISISEKTHPELSKMFKERGKKEEKKKEKVSKSKST